MKPSRWRRFSIAQLVIAPHRQAVDDAGSFRVDAGCAPAGTLRLRSEEGFAPRQAGLTAQRRKFVAIGEMWGSHEDFVEPRALVGVSAKQAPQGATLASGNFSCRGGGTRQPPVTDAVRSRQCGQKPASCDEAGSATSKISATLDREISFSSACDRGVGFFGGRSARASS